MVSAEQQEMGSPFSLRPEAITGPENEYKLGTWIGKNPKEAKKILGSTYFSDFDGDGNIMMNLGTLVTIGSLKPKNLVHIVFDNNSHESTGGQPTNSKNIKIDNIANETNFKTFQVNTKDELEKTLKKIKNMAGPIFLLIKVSKSKSELFFFVSTHHINLCNSFFL